jgi:hypothetical protein
VADNQAQRKLESLFPDDFPDLGKFQQLYSSEAPGQYITTGVIMLVAAAGPAHWGHLH